MICYDGEAKVRVCVHRGCRVAAHDACLDAWHKKSRRCIVCRKGGARLEYGQLLSMVLVILCTVCFLLAPFVVLSICRMSYCLLWYNTMDSHEELYQCAYEYKPDVVIRRIIYYLGDILSAAVHTFF